MSDELSSALRELAADHATRPAVGAAEIRGRAMRRRRRRRAAVTLGAGATVLALLGFALSLHLGGDPDHPDRHRTPAVAPSAPAPPSATTAVPVSGTLDLPGHTLTFGGRVLPIVSEFDAPAGPTSPMTVAAKQDRRTLTVDVPSKGNVSVDVPYVVELRDEQGRPLYAGAFTPQLKILSGYDARGGLISLPARDAQWFYARVRLGDTIAVKTATTPTPAPSTTAPAPGATASPSDEARVTR
ncbi:hypothetical protein [Streptomyces sp. NBC_00005]|uniref:hypothetical protein n=1 Tax=Streptomyces sp. NBC_00005 TaxID=2903609 RepID=UPI003249F0E4